MFTGRFVLDIPLGTGRFLNQMAKWYRLGAYRLNPFGVREVSKPRAIRQHHSRAVLIPLKIGRCCKGDIERPKITQKSQSL